MKAIFKSIAVVFLSLSFLCILASCNKVNPEVIPIVSTSSNVTVYYKTADVSGKVTDAYDVKTVGFNYGTEKDKLTSFSAANLDGDNIVGTISGLTSGGKYYFQAVAKTKHTTVVGEIHEFQLFFEGPIDLGLPSKTLWASSNVDATYPHEIGGYYAWGETKEKAIYNWTSYIYCNGDEYTITKYNQDDGKTQLETIDDAAYQKSSGKLRIPTNEQWAELRSNCTVMQTTINGVSGWKIYNKHGNGSPFIFFPRAGYYYGYDFYGLYSDYWTSTRSSSSSALLDFSRYADSASFGSSISLSEYSKRTCGLNLRGVYVQ